MSQWLSPLSACLSIQDRVKTESNLTKLVAALAVYRTENGEYPEQLEQLVPDVIPTLPVDLYHAKPFVYHPDADGYLLYLWAQMEPTTAAATSSEKFSPVAKSAGTKMMPPKNSARKSPPGPTTSPSASPAPLSSSPRPHPQPTSPNSDR